MARVEIAGDKLTIDGRPIFLRAGEIHYFRVKREDWADRLDKAVKNHLNCIAAYIPWDFHEFEEGRFDFTGKRIPETDLAGFIEMVRERGLYFFSRPGPFINGGYVEGGHPRWIFEKYPEVVSRRADGGEAFWVGQGNHYPSQLHEIFLSLVEGWYSQIIPFIAARSIERGGPVILNQPDNEMNLCFTYFHPEHSLYDAHILGQDGQEGLFHRYLRERYGDLPSLNARYGTDYRSVSEISPRRKTGSQVGDLRLFKDWMRFRQYHIFVYAEKLHELDREYGLTIPDTYNEPVNTFFRGPGNHAGFSAHMRARGKRLLTTGHSYMRYSYHLDFHGLPTTIYRMEAVRTQLGGGPVITVEQGAGWANMNEMSNMLNYPAHLRACLGHGMDGYSYYMFAAGKKGFSRNYHTDTFTHHADPLGPDGEEHTSYEMTQEFNYFVKQWEKELLGTKKAADVVIGFSTDLFILEGFAAGSEITVNLDNTSGYGSLTRNEVRRMNDHLKDLMKILALRNVNFALMNLDDPHREPGFGEVLVIPNPGMIPRRTFDYLREHVRRGGRVVFYPCLPTHDTDGYECGLLAEEYGYHVRAESGRYGMAPGDIGRRFLDMRDVTGIAVNEVRTFFPPDGGEILATYRGEACAYRQRHRDGQIVVMGFLPQLFTLENLESTKKLLLEAFGAERNCHTAYDRYHAVCRYGPEMDLVTVVNSVGGLEPDRIAITPGGEKFWFPRLTELEIRPLQARCLCVNTKLPYATLKYCTSEIVPVDETRRRFLATGDPGTTGEIAFDRRVSIRCDGRALALREHEGMWIATYTHGVDKLNIEVG